MVGAPLPDREANKHEVTVVRVSGEVDLAIAPELRERLRRAIDADGNGVVLDLGDVTFMDSAGLSVLVDARRQLESTHRELRIVRPTPAVRRLLDLAGVDGLFQIDLDGEPPT
jgi:anti-sigma B factor antagonist